MKSVSVKNQELTPLIIRFTCRRALLSLATMVLAVAAMMPGRCFGLAIAPAAAVNLGGMANAIVQIEDPSWLGTGTIINMAPITGGDLVDVLTADHVVRNPNPGENIYPANQISVTFGTGVSISASSDATDFTWPQDLGSGVDLAMLALFVPQAQLGGLTSASLPTAQPAANTAIVQAGYGRQGTVATVDGNPAYVSLGPDFGTLLAGPNTINGNGVTFILNGAQSAWGGKDYSYFGFQNGCLINGANSTSYIFSGDSGGPSLSGNTILGVHSSSVTWVVAGYPNSQFAYDNNAAPNYLWQDVSVFDNLTWINTEIAALTVPEPSSVCLVILGGSLVAACRRKRKRVI
jgi:hypothetical protein